MNKRYLLALLSVPFAFLLVFISSASAQAAWVDSGTRNAGSAFEPDFLAGSHAAGCEWSNWQVGTNDNELRCWVRNNGVNEPGNVATQISFDWQSPLGGHFDVRVVRNYASGGYVSMPDGYQEALANWPSNGEPHHLGGVARIQIAQYDKDTNTLSNQRCIWHGGDVDACKRWDPRPEPPFCGSLMTVLNENEVRGVFGTKFSPDSSSCTGDN